MSGYVGQAIVLRDGLPLVHLTDGDAFRWLLWRQPQSVDYALTHGGYEILEPDTDAKLLDFRGWIAYLNQRDHPSGVDGTTVAILEQVRRMAEDNGGALLDDYIVQEQIVEPMLKAALIGLNYTAGNLSLVNHKLDAAARALAVRFGIDGDAL